MILLFYTLHMWIFSISVGQFFVEGKAKNRRCSHSTARFFNATIGKKGHIEVLKIDVRRVYICNGTRCVPYQDVFTK